MGVVDLEADFPGSLPIKRSGLIQAPSADPFESFRLLKAVIDSKRLMQLCGALQVGNQLRTN